LERGKVKALKTGEEGLKFTDNAPEEREIALFKLKSMPTPCFPEELTLTVKELMVGAPEAEEEKTHTDALAQLAEPAVMSEAVSFRKVISGLEKATFTV
jgi:hypothetical protein